MKTLILNNHTKYLEDLKTVFPDSTIIEQEELVAIDFDIYDLLVISGGSHVPTVLHHPEKYASSISVLKGVSIPILGICLGCELITYAYGMDA